MSLSPSEIRPAEGLGSTESTPTGAWSRWARLLSPAVLFAAAGLLLVAGFLLAFWYAPTDSSTVGFSQKVFYFHAPVAETALVAFAVAFVAGVLYLRRQDPKYDRLGVAAVRLGLLFSLLVMATGMIWGKAAWGTWWAWEPRLTTFLIACVLYGAYFVVRWTVEEEERRATFAAVFAMVAFLDVPITFFATRYLPAGLHPVVLTMSGSGMEARMLLAFLVCIVGMTLLLVAMLRLELQLAGLRLQVEELKDLLAGEQE
jgi:heme exporter protein C